MRSRNARTIVPLVLAATLSSCNDSQGVEGCLGDVDVSVIRSDPPAFSWSPACGVSDLQVSDGANRIIWGIQGGVGKNEIEPPVTFGVVPEGASESFEPGELDRGFSYIVRVFRLHPDDRTGEIEFLLAGEDIFRW